MRHTKINLHGLTGNDVIHLNHISSLALLLSTHNFTTVGFGYNVTLGRGEN